MQYILTAQVITSGTLLEAILGMRNNIHRLFVVNTYIPSDMPSSSGVEYAIDIIKQSDAPRFLVIAWRFNGNLLHTRSILNDNWTDTWHTIELS